MKNRLQHAFAILAIVAVPFAVQTEPPAAIAADVECDDNVPRLGCKIWEVEFEFGVPPSISCTTGSTWKCLSSGILGK